jgi:pheromone shutdown protein TraB
MTDSKGSDTEGSESEETDFDKELYIVPTSHASEKSGEDVKEAINNVKPDIVGLELDNSRIKRFQNDNLENLSDRSSIDILKSTKGISIKGRIILTIFSLMQTKIASKLGIDVLGLDMKAGYDVAKENNIPIALIDRNIQKTFNRFTDQISIIEFLKTIAGFIIAYIMMFFTSKKDYDMESTNISEAVDHMGEYFPTLKRILIDERDEHIAKNAIHIAENNDRTLIVIGAAHEAGVEEYIIDSEKVNLKNLYEIEEFADLQKDKSS